MRGFDRLSYLVSGQQAQLQADIIGRQHFLSRHEQRRLAHVQQGPGVMATPADVSAGAEDFDKLTLVIEQANVTFRHEKRVTEFLHDRSDDDAYKGGDNDYDDNGVVQCVLLSEFKLKARSRKPPSRWRENRLRVLTELPSGCARAPVLLPRTMCGVSPVS